MEDHHIKHRERVSYHDCSIVVEIHARTQFVNHMNGMMWPCSWKTYANHVVEEINQVVIQNMETMLEKLGRKAFLVCYFTKIHYSNNLLDILHENKKHEGDREVT